MPNYPWDNQEQLKPNIKTQYPWDETVKVKSEQQPSKIINSDIDAIEAQRLSVASSIPQANVQPVKSITGMPSKAEEYETRVNYAPTPATVPQMSYADFKKQEYNIPKTNTVKPYENRGRYIVVDDKAEGRTPGIPAKEPSQKVPDNQPSWGKTVGSSLLGGVAQTNASMFNVPRKIIEGVSIGLDKVLPDFIYNKEMQNNDPIKKALDKAVKSNEERAMQYQKDLEGAKGIKGFVAAGLPALPQIVMAAAGGVATQGSSALSGLSTAAKQLLPFGALAAGGYAREAENEGASYGQQVAYGLLGGTAEAATEVIPLGRALDLMKKFGAGEIAEKGAKTLIGKYGKTALQVVENLLLEGAQEGIMSPLGRGAQKITYKLDMAMTGENGVFDLKDIKDSAYAGISMAAILGGLGLPASYASHKMAVEKIEGNKPITPDFIQNELMPALQKDTAAIENESNQAAKIQQAPAEFNWALNQVISGRNIPASLEAKYPVLVEFRNNLRGEQSISQPETPQASTTEVQDKPIETINQTASDSSIVPVGNEKKAEVQPIKNIGYHAGDLGKAEHFGRQFGSSRDTGHFGTGTYFVGDKKNIQIGGYKDRPMQEVELSDYKLFKPKNESTASKLHNLLRYANNYYMAAQRQLVPDDVISDLQYSEPDVIISELKKLGKWDEETFQNYFKISSDEYIEKKLESPDIYRYLKDELVRDLINDNEKIERALDRKEEFEENVESILGIDKGKAAEMLDNIYKDIEKQYGSSDTWTMNNELDKSDSVSTRFMKALGYEGVDVRHIPTYDNTGYGTVVYDLKENKKQEPTANTPQELLTKEKPKEVETIIEGGIQAQKDDKDTGELKANPELEPIKTDLAASSVQPTEEINQEPQIAAEQRKEFAEEVAAEKKLTNKQIEERVTAIDEELDTLKKKQTDKALSKESRAEISDKIVTLLSERNGLEKRVAQIIDNPKSNKDKLQNVLINEQLSTDGIEIAKGKRYGFDYSQREQIAEELIEGSKTDAQKINIKVRNDGTMNVVNSEPVIADIMNELGIKKAETKIPYNMDKNAYTRIIVDSKNKWATPNGFYAAKVTEEEIKAMKDYAGEKKLQFSGDTDLTKNLLDSLEGATIELTEIPKEQETVSGKKKEKWYIFKVGDKLYAFDKSYFDIFNKDGNRFFVSDSAVMPMAVKDTEGNLVGAVLPARTKVTQEGYEELNPATGKDFFSKAKPKSNKSGTKSSAMTGALPLMPQGNNTATMEGKDGAKTVDEIVSIIEKAIGVPIRTGKFRQKAYGIFKQLPEVIRTKVTNDLPVISHEVGHYLDKVYDLAKKQFDNELQTLGKVTSRPSYSKEEVRAEGVAEFVRLYLTDPQQATAKAPDFLAHFETAINTELLKELNDLRREIGKVNNLPPTQKILNDISIGESRKATKENSISGFLQKFYDAWLDEFDPITRAYHRAINEGWTGKNVNIMAKLYRGLEAKVKANLKYSQTDLEGNVVGESLENILKPIRKQYKEFIAYMVSRRAIDYHRRNMVMPQPYSTYYDTLIDLDSKYPHFADVFDKLGEWEDNNLQLLVDSGIMTQDTVDNIKENNPNHVPLYRIQEAVDTIRTGSGNTLGQSKKVIKKAKGSGKTIIDPIESIIADAFIVRRAAEANSVLGTLADMADKIEGFGDVMEAVPPGIKGTTFNVEEISKTLEDMGIDTEGVDLDKLVTIFRVNYSERPNEITVYRNGKPKLYQMESEIFKAIKGLNRQASHFLIRMLNVPKRVIQAGAVTTVQFVMRNIARDTQTSLINSEAGINPIDIMKGYASAIKKDKWFKQWILSGGASEYIQVADRTNVQDLEADILGMNFKDKVLDLIQQPTKEKAIRVLLAPMRAIREGIEWSEAGPRIAEMRKGIEKGVSKDEATAWSRDLSQDFVRYGYYGKEFNKITAFFNANVQGIEKQIRTFKDHPYRTLLRGLLYVTLPTVLLYFWNDDNEEYKRMAAWRKALFYNIPLGNRKTTQHFLSIPKPYGWGYLFGALPEIILDEIRRDEPDTWKNIKEGFTTNFSIPFMPSAVGPVFEVATNKSWNQKPIESKADEMKPAYLRYGDYTSTLSKGIANAAKDANISPKKLDYLVKGYTGSVGDFFWKLPDTISKNATEGIDAANIPVVRAFMTDTVYSNDTLDTFYNYGTELNQRKMEADEIGTYRAISNLPKQTQEQLAGSLKNARTEYNAVAKSFSEAKKQIMDIQHSDKFSPAEKKVRTREIQIKIVKKAEAYNKKYEQFKQKYKIK
jgi:hypothetical protein